MKRSYFNAKPATEASLHKNENNQSFEMNEFFDMTNEEFDDEKDENKRKNRNLSEKKRRDQFNLLINELCLIINYNTPPISNQMEITLEGQAGGNKQKTDKSSILRASIEFLKTHSEVLNKNQEQGGIEQKLYENETCAESGTIFSWKPSFLVNDEFIHLMLEALDSFIIIVEANNRGNLIYVSETVFPLLGLIASQLNQKLQNNSDDKITIYDLIHKEERSFVENLLTPNQANSPYELFSSILLHFKNHDFDNESETYQLVRLIGSFYEMNDVSETLIYGQPGHKYFIGIGRLQTPRFLRELSFQSSNSENEFISRNSLEWKFLYLDHRASPIIGYLPFEILGTSGYDYYHWNDLDDVVAGHEQLMRTGEGTSCIYRFLTKSQQWIWLQTNYYIAYHHWNSKPEFIVCTNTIVKECDVSYAKSMRGIVDRNCLQSQDSRIKDNDASSVLSSMDSTSVEPRSNTTSLSWSSNRDSEPSNEPSADYMNPRIPNHFMGSMSGMSVMSETTENPNEGSAESNSQMDSPKKHSVLHEFLKQKHSLLEHQIKQQQEELRRVTEQLVLVKAVNNE